MASLSRIAVKGEIKLNHFLTAFCLVDDDRVDMLTVKRAFLDIHVDNPLQVTAGGEVALNLLRISSSSKAGLI